MKNKMQAIRKIDKRKLAKYIVVASSLAFISVEALAAFDIDKGMTAWSTPLLKAAGDHWGKLAAIGGVGTAVISQGDMRLRATNALVGTTAVAGACLLILGIFT